MTDWKIGSRDPFPQLSTKTAVPIFAENQSPVAIAYGAGLEETKNRARLIAAAPETAAERDRLKDINADLLAALEEAIDYVPHGRFYAGPMRLNEQSQEGTIYERGCAAIAKARQAP